jgi:hypothetical protein
VSYLTLDRLFITLRLLLIRVGPAMEHDAAGAAALMIIHSLILSLVEKGVLDPEEIHGALEDVIGSRRDRSGDSSVAARHEAALRLAMQLADDIARIRPALPDLAPSTAHGSQHEPH